MQFREPTPSRTCEGLESSSWGLTAGVTASYAEHQKQEPCYLFGKPQDIPGKLV